MGVSTVFFFFRNAFSGCKRHTIFFSRGKGRMGRVRGYFGLLRGFDYEPVPSNLTGYSCHGNSSLGPKGELGRGGGSP